MIAEVLNHGAKHAKSGRTLARMFQTDIRTITATIERERRDGKPICASYEPKAHGYYLAETDEELKRYCQILEHRAQEMQTTRRALMSIKLPGE
jgi:hypothetical protein